MQLQYINPAVDQKNCGEYLYQLAVAEKALSLGKASGRVTTSDEITQKLRQAPDALTVSRIASMNLPDEDIRAARLAIDPTEWGVKPPVHNLRHRQTFAGLDFSKLNAGSYFLGEQGTNMYFLAVPRSGTPEVIILTPSLGFSEGKFDYARRSLAAAGVPLCMKNGERISLESIPFKRSPDNQS